MAGKRLFCNRRWLNPNDLYDRMDLAHTYDALTAKFPGFARCSRIAFFQCLAEVCTAASSELASDSRAATLSPSSDTDADHEESWTPKYTPPPPSSYAIFSCSPAPTSCAVFDSFDIVDTLDAFDAPSPFAAAWESVPASTPAGNYSAETSLEIGIPPPDADLSWPSGHDAPAKRRRTAALLVGGEGIEDYCVHLGAWAGLNAGEAVDMGLYQRWASVPTIDVDRDDLENFGRSGSF